MNQKPTILCVNPWIHDFAAYDFWSKPLGLLSLAGLLRQCGCTIFYIDCTDRFHPRARASPDPPSRFGRGPYRKSRLPRPPGLTHLPRHFSRYGIAPEWFRDDLRALPTPDLVLVTSIMTYWYPGTEETIARIKEIFPQVPVILGGIYATLCPDHARENSRADEIAPHVSETDILDLVARHTGASWSVDYNAGAPATRSWPAFDLQHKITYIPLLTGRGCPFACPYCASNYLDPEMSRRDPAEVVREIEYWHRTFGVRDFVFYDDALLINAEFHFLPLAERLLRKRLPLRFHTPNALHIRAVNETTAPLMKKLGFETIRLGLETAAFDNRTAFDAKVTRAEFQRAVSCLRTAGFDRRQTGAYLLVGLPRQSLEVVEESIRIVRAAGLTPIPTYYSPIPHTLMWPAAVAASPYDLEADPIFANNAVFPCTPEGFSWETITRLKGLSGRT
ncbi:MAG: B12-binding domain-containing radical SAM protein [Desulfosudaceae bacterium]